MKKLNSKNSKGQSTIELALMLSILFSLTFFGIKQFITIYNAKSDEINTRNEALLASQNAKSGWAPGGKMIIPEMGTFDIPGGFSPPSLLPVIISPLLDGLTDTLGLEGTDSWWKSGIKGGLNAYVQSGFNEEKIPYGFLYGVNASGDATGEYADLFGSVGGAALQGTLNGAIISEFKDWNYAIKNGIGEAWSTDAMQGQLSKTFGQKDFFVSTANGAVIGGLSGRKDGILKGAATGALESKLVQGNLGKALGGKDYLVNASNSAILTTISGGKADAIFTNAAQSAFMTQSVQKSIFGENPNAIIRNTANSTVSGAVTAIQTGDVKQLYYSAGGGALGGIISEAAGIKYPEPGNPEKLQKYIETEQFITSLSTVGIMVLDNPKFAQSYASTIASQITSKTIDDKIKKAKASPDKKSKEDKDKAQDKEKKKEEPKKVNGSTPDAL